MEQTGGHPGQQPGFSRGAASVPPSLGPKTEVTNAHNQNEMMSHLGNRFRTDAFLLFYNILEILVTCFAIIAGTREGG